MAVINSLFLLFAGAVIVSSFQPRYHQHESAKVNHARRCGVLMSMSGDEGVEEYRNVATKVLSNFMQKEGSDSNDAIKENDPLADIDFAAPKLANADKLSLEDLAKALDYELYNSEWFVTGRVNPIYFADEFRFEDPDVKLEGIEKYARGVNTLFDQKTSRAEIISTVVNTTVPNTITCTWRLSGKANILSGLTLKPYIVYTDFRIDESTGLIVFQEDRFDLPQWDILLSSLFPFLIGKVTATPAPPVAPREVTMPALFNVKTAIPVPPKMKAPFTGIFGDLFSKQ